jgi:hypothetical protein
MLDAPHNSSQEFQPKKKNLLGSFSLSWKNKVAFFLPESKQLSDMRHPVCSCTIVYFINLLDKQVIIPFYSAMKQCRYSPSLGLIFSTVWLSSLSSASIVKVYLNRCPLGPYEFVCNRTKGHMCLFLTPSGLQQ